MATILFSTLDNKKKVRKTKHLNNIRSTTQHDIIFSGLYKCKQDQFLAELICLFLYLFFP